MAAPPKTGKSWLAADIASSVSNGTPFWNHRVKKGACIYFDLEGSKSRAKERLINKMHVNTSGDLFFVNNAARIEDGFFEQLSQVVDAHDDMRLVIIDTWGRIKGGSSRRNVNAYDQDTDMLGPLQTFALTRGLAIVIVTHYSKSKSYRSDDPFERIVGSGAQFGVADAAWTIDGERNDEEKTLRIAGRDIDGVEYAIRFDRETFRWELLGDAQEIQQNHEYDDYRKDTLVITIKHLVTTSGNSKWTGTAAALRDEVFHQTGDNSMRSGQAVTARIKKVSEKLRLIDNIHYKAPNANGGSQGRNHVFYKMCQ